MKRYLPTQKFVFQPSKILGVLLVFLHFGAIGCLLPLAIAWFMKALLSGLIGLNLVVLLRNQVLLMAKESIKGMRLQAGEWFLTLSTGVEFNAEFLGATYVTNLLVLLLFQVGAKKHVVVIFKDAIQKEEFRRLKVLLNCWGNSRKKKENR